MNIYIISTLFFAFSALIIGLLIYLKRRDSLGKYWCLFCVFNCIWGTGYALQMSYQWNYEHVLWVSRIADAAAIFIPVAWLRFVVEFLGLKANRKIFVPLYFISTAIFVTSPTAIFIKNLKDKSHIGFEYFVNGGVGFYAFTVLFVLIVCLGFYLISKELFGKQIPAERRRQFQFLILATSCGFLGGSLAFLPAYDIDVPAAWGSLLLPFMPVLMVFAITRFRFLDIDEIMKAAQRDKLAAIGTLATSINHEIKNPLYIIQGFADSFLANVKDGVFKNDSEVRVKAEDILKKIGDQSQRALDIMKRFAAFSKQNLDREMQAEDISLTGLIENIMPLVGHELELDKIELVKDIPGDLPPVRADRRHLEEIFFNLIVNACQAMKSGGRIEINAAFDAEKIRISVKDTGPGIPADKVAQIFEPFFTTKEEGTGLGLYVTKQLVERNGGKITVESRVGKGTSFVLEFPVAG
ncbi:MAG: ATP-binding protein [Candidatus Omnitrophica bacterium]|nr:ATP-binding protein [Candidatus Omnitrophota bacterium]MDD5671253.1 ATP-binding protein [Candidatus Omnitrophota bacterium]